MTTPGVVPPEHLVATDEEFYLINELIERSFGISYPEHMRNSLVVKLRPRLRELHLTSFHEYYVRLEANLDGELDQLAVLATNNETYFFRGRNHFESLVAEGLDMLTPRLTVPGIIRVLVAGCSSGEEAYTLNFFLRDANRDMGTPEPRIEAFDVDSLRVRMSQRAVYRERSLRDTTPEEVARYLRPLDTGLWEVKKEYTEGVSFSGGNIMNRSSFESPLPYDVVFCRNVLIYFSQEALRRAIDNFASVLRKDGLLFLGHSESIAGLTPAFQMVKVPPCIAYKKVGP